MIIVNTEFNVIFVMITFTGLFIQLVNELDLAPLRNLWERTLVLQITVFKIECIS